eukprot:5003696-Alexandrium_andersonii.AAC.1
MGGDFEGMAGRLAQTVRVALGVRLPEISAGVALGTSVADLYRAYGWLAHNTGTKGLIDPRAPLITLAPQIPAELAHSSTGFDYAHRFRQSLFENEAKASDV